MAPPRYFVPGDFPNVVNVDLLMGTLEEVGLDYIFDTRANALLCSRKVLSNGPSGGPGIVIVSTPRGKSRVEDAFGYFPERQEWTEEKEGRFWIGVENEDPPQSSDLLRYDPIPGHWVRLNGGGSWMIPLARVYPSGVSNLPTVVLPEDDGSISYEVKSEFRSISEAADKFASFFFGTIDEDELRETGQVSIPTDIGDEEFARVAVEALALNYRVSPFEVRVLELLTVDDLREVGLALVDWPTVVAMVHAAKKKGDSSDSPRSGGSGTSSSEDSIDRPSENLR